MFVWHDSFWLAYICRKEHKFIRSRSSSTLVRNVKSSKIFRRPSTPELLFLCCAVLGLPGCVQSHILILKYISSQRKRILALSCDVKTILPKRFPSSVTRISHITLKTDTMARPDLRDSLRESFFFQFDCFSQGVITGEAFKTFLGNLRSLGIWKQLWWQS